MIEIISNEIITNLRLIDLMPPLLSFAESLDFFSSLRSDALPSSKCFQVCLLLFFTTTSLALLICLFQQLSFQLV